jgi:hypothetical protein
VGVSTPVAGKANGLATAVNIITAPREAFETLRISPMWGWAFVVAVVLTAIGQYLGTPATAHAIQASWPAQVAANPQLAGASAETQQNALNVSLAIVKWVWLGSPVIVLIAALLAAIVMLIFKAVGRGDANFKQLWCAAMNVAVVSVGLSSLLTGLIAVVRGPATYNSTADAYKAMPSLAWLTPHASVKLTAFLAAFSVIGIWGAVLIAMAMLYVARTSKAVGAIVAILILCIGGAFLAWGAR